jgi:hypothetical protein
LVLGVPATAIPCSVGEQDLANGDGASAGELLMKGLHIRETE